MCVCIQLLSRVQLFVTPWTVHEILQARTLEWVAFPFSNMSDYRLPKRRKNFETMPFKCMVKMSSSTVKLSFSSSNDKYSIFNIKPQDKVKGPSPDRTLGQATAGVERCVSAFVPGSAALFPTRVHITASQNLNYVLAREVHGQRVGRRDDEAHGGHEHVHAPPGQSRTTCSAHCCLSGYIRPLCGQFSARQAAPCFGLIHRPTFVSFCSKNRSSHKDNMQSVAAFKHLIAPPFKLTLTQPNRTDALNTTGESTRCI